MGVRIAAVLLGCAVLLFHIVGNADPVNVTATNPALFSFNAPGSGPFTAIGIAFEFSPAVGIGDAFAFSDQLAFAIYNALTALNQFPGITFFIVPTSFPDNDGFLLVTAPAGSFDIFQTTVSLGTGTSLFDIQLGPAVVAELVNGSAAPEPATMGLLAIGLLAIAFARRRPMHRTGAI
jgi:hypothetical protein